MSRRLIYVLTILALLFGMVGFQPVKPVQAANNLRISQVSGDAGAPDSIYKDKFIELFNAGNASASLAGLSLQYADNESFDLGNVGTFHVAPLPDVSIAPGGYYLIKVASIESEKPPIIAADYDLSQLQPYRTIDNAYGKLALVSGIEPLNCSSTGNPCGQEQLDRIIDRVAYGGLNFYEGDNPGPLAGVGLSIQRKDAGCQDTDQNGADFETALPSPRNSDTPAHSCAPTSNPDAIFFSEYIEGSSFNKALEIYNATGATVDLSDIKIELYPNGATAPAQSVVLSGTLTDKGTFVAAHNQAAQDILDKAQLTDGAVINFNGDDAVVLRRVSTDAVLDTIGQVGNRPAAGYWGTGDVTTKDDTLVRKPDICAGDTTPDDAYDPATEWLGYPINTFTHLGSHESNCNQAPILGPKVQSIVPANNAMAPKTADIVITFSETVTVADGWYDITCTQSGAHTAAVTDANPVFTLNPDADFTSGETCTVTIDKDKVTNAANETMAENFVSNFTIVEGCGDTYTAIYEIQGDGTASPLVNEVVTTEGVVTANFQVGGKRGYTIQDPEGDNNPATSDGIFVFSTNPTVNVGDRLRITGKVTEYYEMTQLTPTSAATVLTCSTGHEITPTEITLPVAAPRDYEPYEGMLVTFPQALYIAEYYNFDRYGEIVLSGTRHNSPTSVVEPGDDAIAAEEAYQLDSIKVDDTLTSQNPPYLRHPDGSQFTKEHYFRGGDTITGLTGIMDYNFNEWKIQPVGTATYTQLNPRPEAPEMVPGEIRIASLNVLNYFVTLDDGSNNCGPAGNMNCRGADNQEEFDRQHAKIVAAILGMEADVIGLIEIENEHPNMEADGAVKHLVAALNTETDPGTYDYVATGNIGTDAIKQAFIYKPAKVELVGNVAILDETFDPAYDTTRNRPSLAVSFKDKITDEIFTVSVNHLKSKGSACEGDPDLGDGQGNCNLTRKRAAEVLVKWLETDPTDANSDMYVIIGDLNSYAKEDPIDAIKLGADETEGTADDVTNLVEVFNEPDAYGYVFDGKAGYLDHALANKKFAYYVLDAKFWHINADEADVFDYDTSFKPAEQAALYSPDAYRSSDHDPILISLTLYKLPIISSADMAGPYLVTREQIFSVKLENPENGATYQQISADVKMAGATLATIEKIEVENPLDPGDWVVIQPVLDGSDGIKAAVGPYPADVYFKPGEAPVLNFRITFAEVGDFETTGSLYDASGTGDPVLLADYTDTMVVKAKPTLSEEGLAGPYKVGEAKTFVITMNNPTNGMAFAKPKGVVELSRADGEAIVEADVISVEVEFPFDSGNWLDLKDNTTIVDGKAVMDVGPISGLEIVVPQEMSLRYRINFAKAGVYNVTGTLYDSDWEPDFALASLTGVMNVYHGPVAVDDAYTTNEDVVLNVEAPGVLANDTDPDSPVLTAVLEEGPTHGTLVLNADGSFTYTPELNYHGTDSFTYKASDGTNESNIATVTITINSVNDAPVAVDDAYTVAEDAVLTVPAADGVLANDYDVDGDVLSATLLTNVSHGTLVLLSDGSFTYTPEADFFGTDSFTYTLLSHPNTQDEGWTDWATVTITVTPVNDAPVLDEIPDFTIFTLEELTFMATASDVDDTELTFSLVDAPEGATIDPETGEFTWTPTVEQVGEHEIELCVSDGELEDCQTFKVTVLPLNQAPIAVADAYEVAQDGVLSVVAPGVLENDSDPEDAELTAELVTTTQFGTLILNPNGSFIYVPNEGYAGEDSFTYKAFDGEFYSAEATVTITVKAPPVWNLFFPTIQTKGY